jgi:stalled ribosome rescue protein Dom34
MRHHAILWIDQHEAKVFRLTEEGIDASTFASHHKHVLRHPRSTIEHEHPDDAQRFYHEVARSLDGAGDVLVVGPAKAKLELIKHIQRHDRGLEARVVGVETIDHPTDAQLVAYARSYFEAGHSKR